MWYSSSEWRFPVLAVLFSFFVVPFLRRIIPNHLSSFTICNYFLLLQLLSSNVFYTLQENHGKHVILKEGYIRSFLSLILYHEYWSRVHENFSALVLLIIPFHMPHQVARTHPTNTSLMSKPLRSTSEGLGNIQYYQHVSHQPYLAEHHGQVLLPLHLAHVVPGEACEEPEQTILPKPEMAVVAGVPDT